MNLNSIIRRVSFVKQNFLYNIDKFKWAFLLAGSKNIILGPWTGEVGPEAQYWIPYLRKIHQLGFLGSGKLIAISRGRVESWYSDFIDQYIDIFDYRSEKEFAKLLIKQEFKSHKQLAWTDSERLLVEEIARRNKIEQFVVVHPSIMWREIIPWLEERVKLDTVLAKLSFKKFPKSNKYIVDFVDNLKLPKKYIAIKFYANDIFVNNKENKQFVNKLINRISKKAYLVSLDSTTQVDDHKLFKIDTHANVIQIKTRVSLKYNLGVQTEILRRADSFIGTNGGFSVLAAFLGKPCLSFYSEKLGNYARIHFQHETITAKLSEELNSTYSVICTKNWQKISL